MSVGGQIKELRIKAGFTQSELANKTGITIRTIQRIENNEVNASLHSLKKISEVLGENILPNTGEPISQPNELNIHLKISDMNQLVFDLKKLVKNNWKILAIILTIILFLMNYSDIKSGFVDAWNGK